MQKIRKIQKRLFGKSTDLIINVTKNNISFETISKKLQNKNGLNKKIRNAYVIVPLAPQEHEKIQQFYKEALAKDNIDNIFSLALHPSSIRPFLVTLQYKNQPTPALLVHPGNKHLVKAVLQTIPFERSILVGGIIRPQQQQQKNQQYPFVLPDVYKNMNLSAFASLYAISHKIQYILKNNKHIDLQKLYNNEKELSKRNINYYVSQYDLFTREGESTSIQIISSDKVTFKKNQVKAVGSTVGLASKQFPFHRINLTTEEIIKLGEMVTRGEGALPLYREYDNEKKLTMKIVLAHDQLHFIIPSEQTAIWTLDAPPAVFLNSLYQAVAISSTLETITYTNTLSASATKEKTEILTDLEKDISEFGKKLDNINNFPYTDQPEVK